MRPLTSFLNGTKIASVDAMCAAYQAAEKNAGVPGMIGSVVEEGTSAMAGLGKAIRQAGHSLARPVGAAVDGVSRSAGSAGPIRSAFGRGVSAVGKGIQQNPGIALGTAAGAGALGTGFVAGRATS